MKRVYFVTLVFLGTFVSSIPHDGLAKIPANPKKENSGDKTNKTPQVNPRKLNLDLSWDLLTSLGTIGGVAAFSHFLTRDSSSDDQAFRRLAQNKRSDLEISKMYRRKVEDDLRLSISSLRSKLETLHADWGDALRRIAQDTDSILLSLS